VPEGIHIAGTGSLAAEVAEIARGAGHDVVGLVELRDPARVGTEIHGLPVISLGPPPSAAARVVIAAGEDRPSLAARLRELGWTAAAVVHPQAHVGESATVSEGAIVSPGVVVGAAAAVGRDSLLSRGALVGHHTTIGSAVSLRPGANVAGNCVVGDGAVIGIGAVVVDHVRVGTGAVVAAGAVVLRDVGCGERVQGLPARPYPPPAAG
jgi:sugar O-acyltransferase (sialic acid O-acetyltransferase NeuD family)